MIAPISDFTPWVEEFFLSQKGLDTLSLIIHCHSQRIIHSAIRLIDNATATKKKLDSLQVVQLISFFHHALCVCFLYCSFVSFVSHFLRLSPTAATTNNLFSNFPSCLPRVLFIFTQSASNWLLHTKRMAEIEQSFVHVHQQTRVMVESKQEHGL